MKDRFNLVMVLFLIIIISLIIPSVFSIPNKMSKEIKFLDISQKKGESDNNNTFLLTSILSKTKSSFKADSDVLSSFNKNFQIPTKDLSKERGCQKAEKSKIFDILSPKKDFPFLQTREEQPIIHPTLEETNILRIENEIIC